MIGIDIFSLDLDGNDYWILEAANLEYVSIVVVEYNPLFGSKLGVSVPRDDKFDRTTKYYSCLNYGAISSTFVYILSQKGFIFVSSNRVGSNGFFVRKDLVTKVKLILPTDLSQHTDWRIRESRDNSGEQDYLSNNEGLNQILYIPLINNKDGSELKVEDLS
jgi:hypothetical protein